MTVPVLAAPGRFLLLFVESCGTLTAGKNPLSALPVTADGWPSRQGAASCPLIFGKGGCPMVTYSELFQYTLVIIGIIGLFIAAYKKK